MRRVSNSLRILVLTGCALWLMRTPIIHAQGGCIKQFYAENGTPCFDCCPKQPQDINISDGTEIDGSQGIKSLFPRTADCGSGSCNGGACGTTAYYVEANDPSCCLPSGFPCNQGTCCNGLICLSNNTCGSCIANGQSCQSSSDCCTGNCAGGYCSPTSCPETASCNDYSPGVFPADPCMYPSGGCPSGYNQSNYCCYNATPIVIDALGQGFHITDVNHGVQFKFFPNKPPVQVSWTDAAFRNGWLALDRNGNGLIDDATELFGNLTSQPQNPNRNGYIALAVFDDPQNGGNGNGLIDPGDTVYRRLRVWIDANHNGVSEPGELHRLRELGVFSIDLRYRLSKYVDPNGNQFRYQARIRDKQAGDTTLAMTLSWSLNSLQRTNKGVLSRYLCFGLIEPRFNCDKLVSPSDVATAVGTREKPEG